MVLRATCKTGALPDRPAALTSGQGDRVGTAVGDFATLSLEGSGLERQSRVPPDKRAQGYADRFDATTLWLDAVWTGQEVVLVCPRLNNLWFTVTRAAFALDGRPVRARLRRYYRHTLIALKAPIRPDRVSVRIGDWVGETGVHGPPTAGFAGRNVLMTLSKDNDPAWIEDWARFHVRHHGAQACLFVDNGSAEHGPEAIRPALERAGLSRSVILSAPLRYGPRGKPPFVNAELFLQTGVMNVLRLRFLKQARAVLNCDIDELVMTPGRTVFDLAVGSSRGFVQFPGRWVHPAPGSEGWSWHARHTHADSPARPCPPKWCIVPDGPLGRFQWRPHELEGLPLQRRFRAESAWFYHCRTITNGWKSQSRTGVNENTVPDEALIAALDAADLPRRAG